MAMIISWCRKYSYWILPSIVLCVFVCAYKYSLIVVPVNLDSGLSTVSSLSGTFIGFLLTVLTLYTSTPIQEQAKQRFMQSGHQTIFVRNIVMGILFFSVGILLHLFRGGNYYPICLASFACGMTNLLCAGYYITHLVKYLK